MVKGVKIIKRKENENPKERAIIRIARKLHDTEAIQRDHDIKEATKKRMYFLYIARLYKITEEEAKDLVFSDQNSQLCAGFETLSRIYDLKRDGKYKTADDLIRQHKKDLRQFIAQESARTGKNIKMPDLD